MLQMAFDDLTVIEINHDANFAALAESRWGQTQSHDNFIYILINEAAAGQNTIFRAFGAALFLHGRLYHGTHFAAGELDHNLLPRLESDLDSHAWDNLHKDDAPLTAPLDLLATQLGQSIASITSLLDPGAVIIGCNQIIRNRAFIQRVAERVTKLNLPVPQRHLLVQASDMGQEAITKGAALAATLASDGYTVRQQAEA
jgi:predicted NBD/HSP70 family sugar kinase